MAVGTFVIPSSRTKNKRPHVVPLPALARAIIASAKPVASPVGYVFTNSGKSPVGGWSMIKNRLDDAMVDLRGYLIGINTGFIAVGENNSGMSFAIPINMARSLVDQMLEFGDIRRGALGFTYEDFTSARSRDHGGAVVRGVDPRSVAERAGLKPGDRVTELGGTPVRDAADLQIRLALLRIGEVAEFAVSRSGGTLIVRAEIAKREPAPRPR